MPAGSPRLLGQLLRRPAWLVGVACSGLGAALHGVALRLGSLTLVQPILVSSVLFALALRAAMERRAPTRKTFGCAALAAAGLASFLLVSKAHGGSSHPQPAPAAALLAAGVAVAVLARAWAASKPGRDAGVLLGLAGGILFGLVAGVLKATVALIGRPDLLTSWPLYTLIPLALGGIAVNQHAYQVAPLANSLPALNVALPLVATAFGVIVFGERLAGGAPRLAAQGGAALVIAAGLIGLYRAENPQSSAETTASCEPERGRAC